jgi:hypothetical protein
VLTTAREGAGKRETETPSLGIRFADVLPLSGGRILFGKPIQHNFTGGILRVTLDRIDAYLACSLEPSPTTRRIPTSAC